MNHVVGLSGGKDSTAMALRLKQLNPDTDYTYVFTPTGNEMPSMFRHWMFLQDELGKKLTPMSTGVSLEGLMDRWSAVPTTKMRWCTRVLKIEPFKAYMHSFAPAIAYIGLRADEETRAGTVYGDVDGIEQSFPLREWGWGLEEVWNFLDSYEWTDSEGSHKGVVMPERTDCAWCPFQQLGEWWNLWKFQPDLYERACEWEDKVGHTFRSDSRDSWPASLREMAEEFKLGKVPMMSKSTKYQNELFDRRDWERSCRVCSL